ncbi:MAG TPA: FG-GAP-like repeat-containing protein, partial [Solirubrobacteraceae bacterium]|nr:FG-GAP-like repeat-containing protein [Solirubrobacteraceae bacterium]
MLEARKRPRGLAASLVLAAAALGFGAAAANAAIGFAAAGSPYTVPFAPTAIVTADLDGDGKLDLAAVGQTTFAAGSVAVLLGDGSGRFHPPPAGPVGTTGAGPQGIAAADFNGDGRLDLAVANAADNTVSVLLGDGRGHFTSAPGSPLAVGASPQKIAAADLNGDGRPDIVTVNRMSNDLSVLLNAGAGAFAAHVDYPVGPGAQGPFDVAIGDINGDGKPDLVSANRDSSSVSVLMGNGSGTFAPALSSPFDARGAALSAGPTAVTLADLNLDRRLDVATANFSSKNLSVLLATGSSAGLESLAPGSPFPAGDASGDTPAAIAASDLDADGNPDLITANGGSRRVAFFSGVGNGTFAAPVNFPVSSTGDPVALAVGDFNGDAQPDIAVASADSKIAVMLNTNVSSVGLTPLAIDFGARRVDAPTQEQTATVTNSGTGLLKISSTSIGGADTTDFSIAGDSCSGRNLLVGASCSIDLHHAGTALGLRTAEVVVVDNAPDSP